MYELVAESGGAKKLSYIKQTRIEPGAACLDPKPSRLHNLRFGSYLAAGTTEPKCNAQPRQFTLSPTASTNNNFNFLLFLSKPFKSLHARSAAPRPNETGVRRCLKSTPYNSIRCASIFLQNCLISSRFVSRLGTRSPFFCKKEGSSHPMVSPNSRVSHFFKGGDGPQSCTQAKR
jgi:hypothetical protein